jgi:hypothetical protein
MRDWLASNNRQRLLNLTALAAGTRGLVAVVAAWWFCFALLAIWLGLPGE